MPTKTTLRNAILLFAALLFLPQAGAQSPEITEEVKQKVLVWTGLYMRQAFAPGADFDKWPQFLETQKPAIDKAKTQAEFETAVNTAFSKFGVSHMVLWGPRLMQARNGQPGVGVGVSLKPEPDGMRVTDIYRDAPAEKAGLTVGDLILEADGKKPVDATPLRGAEGSELTLKVRTAAGPMKAFVIKRAKYNAIRVDTLKWPSRDTAVLKLHSFDVSYDAARVEGLMREAGRAKNLVIDLRSNPGGAITNLSHFLAMFMKEGTPIGTLVSKEVVDKYVKATSDKPNDIVKVANWAPDKFAVGKSKLPLFKGHVAVLIDGSSGSSAEMAAAAFQEVLKAPVVGQKTAGSVLAAIMRPLICEYTLQYPVMDYVTIRGVRLEGKGVKPDYPVPVAKPTEPDLTLDRAVLLLKKTSERRNPVAAWHWLRPAFA